MAPLRMRCNAFCRRPENLPMQRGVRQCAAAFGKVASATAVNRLVRPSQALRLRLPARNFSATFSKMSYTSEERAAPNTLDYRLFFSE